MAVVFHSEPKLDNPALIACWPGIGDIGVIAAGALRRMVGAEEFAEIEPFDFFYPKRAFVRGGELKELQFPASKFYFSHGAGRDLIIFIGEEQPAEAGRRYAEGSRAFQMASLVLDAAVRFGCCFVYTSGAAVAPIHHTQSSRVWAVPNSKDLVQQARSYENAILMSDLESRAGFGTITGLNGLLLGVARRRALDGICLMGEIPVYLQGFPIPYPKASKAIVDVLGKALGLKADTSQMDPLIERTDQQIQSFYDSLPSQIREQLDKLKPPPGALLPAERKPTGPITDEDKKRILEDIDKLFKKEPKGD
ncbi:MAG: PAC2 family protein [Chloroflexi bacterium]|nr:PAC2 family protein [Chloroflexota bacterium]